MVVNECTEVCRVVESLTFVKDSAPKVIFELNEIEIISVEKRIPAEKMAIITPIKDKIKKYLS